MCTMYILCIGPALNFESSSETRGAEGMLSTRTQPHFRFVDLRAQLQDSPVRAALGFLVPVDLLAIPLVSAGRRLERGPDVSARCQHRADPPCAFQRQTESSCGHRCGGVAQWSLGGFSNVPSRRLRKNSACWTCDDNGIAPEVSREAPRPILGVRNQRRRGSGQLSSEAPRIGRLFSLLS